MWQIQITFHFILLFIMLPVDFNSVNDFMTLSSIKSAGLIPDISEKANISVSA
jgi:hypothetical protein